MKTKNKDYPARRKSPPGSQARRSRGRPRSVGQAVGREAIVDAARQLLEKLPPHRVPNVLIARKAGVDPALVRYYFPSREELLLAVVEHIISTWLVSHPPEDTPTEKGLATHVSNMFEFSCRVRSMQRLMIEGCAEARSPSVRARVRNLTAAALPFYAKLLGLDGNAATRSPEPLFMHVAIIGLCEFFAAAQAMILPLAPRHMGAAELARRYETFIRELVLDGLRSRLAKPRRKSLGRISRRREY